MLDLADKLLHVDNKNAFPSEKMPRENQSLFDFQMKSFDEFIRQCGEKERYGGLNDYVIYKEGKGKPGLLLGEDQKRNKTILDEIYTKDIWTVMENRNLLSPSFEPPHDGYR